MVKKRDILIFLGMFLLALSLPLATQLVKQSQDDRSRATESSTSKISFKIAFKGVKPSYHCLNSLTKVKVEVANKTTNVYQSDINALLTPVSNETNKDGDQVFLVSNLVLDSKFNNLNTFNYLRVKGSFHLASRMCLNNQSNKLDEVTTCDINLANTNTTTYDFADYSLIPGDINQDGIINTLDYSIIKSNLNASADINCNKTGDLNLDGVVNSFDTSLLKDSLSQKEDGQIINPNPITTNTPTNKPTNTPTPTTTPTTTIRPTNTPTPTKTPDGPNNLLKVSVMADIHNNTSGLKRMMQKTKDRGSSFVVLAGDLAEDGLKKELIAIKNAADSIDIKYAAVPGNHDSRKTYFDDVFGKKYQSIRFDDYKVKLILIDDSYFNGLGSSQKKWLQTEMPECKQITCMIVMHMPLNHPTNSNVWGGYKNSAINKKDAAWLKKMIVANNVKKIAVGHIHEVKNYTLEGFSTQIVSPIKGSKPVYGEFLFNNGQITTTIVSDAIN